MKKIIFISLILLAFQKWDYINGYLHLTPARQVQSSEPVILYSTRSCGYCAKARSLLNEYNIDYTEYDIEHSTAAARRHRALGGRGVPLLVIKGTVVKGYNRDRILELAL